MTTEDENGELGKVKKTTKFMTYARKLAERLKNDCRKDHQRIRLEGGHRTRQSEVYPERLCK